MIIGHSQIQFGCLNNFLFVSLYMSSPFVMVRIDPGYFGKSFLGPGMRSKNYGEVMMPIRMYVYNRWYSLV